MPTINLLPKKKPILKLQSVSKTLLLLIIASIGMYFFRIYHQKPALKTKSEIPELIQENGLLRTYSIHQLIMVGFLKAQNVESILEVWGLVNAPDQQISTIKLGDAIGKEKAQVIAIEAKQIVLQLPNQAIHYLKKVSQSN